MTVSRTITKIRYFCNKRYGGNVSQAWMLTIPRNVPKRAIMLMIQNNDVHKWTIGFEEGKNGYRHYQIRLVASSDGFFEWCKNHIPSAHVEKTTTERGDYERKSGYFISSDDTAEIRQVRFGTLRTSQKKILKEVESQNDREIDVYLDKTGNHGKTWLTIHLWELGRALVVPRASCTPEKISAFVCSAYKGEEFVIIDIPRSRKIDAGLYECIEEIKDGLVFDHRYSGRTRNVRGVKVLIFTNTPLDTKKLSHDRWRLHGITGETTSPP